MLGGEGYMIPQDPVMLLSFVNTKLRDDYDSLDAFCREFDIDSREIEDKLKGIGYCYDREKNRFA